MFHCHHHHHFMPAFRMPFMPFGFGPFGHWGGCSGGFQAGLGFGLGVGAVNFAGKVLDMFI